MKAYSAELRQHIVHVVNGDCSQSIFADCSKAGLISVKRRVKQWRTTGSLIAQFAADPEASFAINCERWEAVTGIRVSGCTMHGAWQRFGWTRKKRLIATKRDGRRCGPPFGR